MRSKIIGGAVVLAFAFLFATNPVVTHAAAQLTGKNIKNGSLSGKDVKNSSLKGKDVKDGSLTGADVRDRTLTGEDILIRASSASKSQDALGNVTGANVALTTTITAPTKGLLLITAGSDVFNSLSADAVSCWVRVDGEKVEWSERTSSLGTNNSEENCSTEASWAVFPGQHTVEFVGQKNLGTTEFDESAMTVLFVPFGKDGQVVQPAA